ncbi:MAG: SprB repeat-containing protein [Bacteroidales bacterium]|nr:SprB repeat-containing protein [Bacteroidales bacterium]
MLKIIIAATLFLALFRGEKCYAQYDADEFPSIGTNFVMAVSQVYPERKLNIRDLGDKVWDLSMFSPGSFDTLRLKLPKKTRYGKRFPEADVAMVITPVQLEYLTIDSGNIYLNGLIDDFMEKKLPVLLRFRDPVLYKNPHLKINEQYSDTSDTYFLSPYFHHPGTDSIKADIRYIRTGRVDAAGKLITPLGEYQVEREVIFIEKKVRGYKYSVFGWTPAPEYSLDRHFTMYRWYTKDSKLPVAEAILNQDDMVELVKYQYDSPLRLTFAGEHVNCKGGSNGMVDLEVTGGIPDYTYQWTNGATTQDLKNVKAGTYRVVVTDNRGRTISSYYTVNEPLVALQANVDVKNVSCRGKRDGRLKLNIIGGKKPYDFTWSNDSINEIITGLAPGKIYYRIIDGGGCLINDSVEITQPEKKLAVDFDTKQVSCFNGNDGKAILFAEGGTPPYRVYWFDNDTNSTRTDLSAGTHKVKVYDNNFCLEEKEITIKQPASPIRISKIIKPVNCFGGSDGKIEISISGGQAPYDYLWPDSSDNKNLPDIQAGSYELTITDKNNCVVKEIIAVPEPETAISSRIQKKDVSCFAGADGEINLEVSGGNSPFSYQWSNGQTKAALNKLKPGHYFVKITDKNNCPAFDTVEIIAPESPLTADFEKFDVKCHNGYDGAIKLIVYGGTPEYSYLWSNKVTQRDITGLKSGKYSVTITDKNLCKLKKEFEINEPAKDLEVTIEKIDVDCYGEKSGSVYLSVTGGIPDYSYIWSNGNDAPSIIGMGAGKYTVEISDSKQCKKTEIIEITEPEKIEVAAKFNLPESDKENGAITIEIKGGYKPYAILWDDGSISITHENIGAGFHEVKVTDAKDCILNQSFELKTKE